MCMGMFLPDEIGACHTIHPFRSSHLYTSPTGAMRMAPPLPSDPSFWNMVPVAVGSAPSRMAASALAADLP